MADGTDFTGVISSKDQLVAALFDLAEIEQTVMCQYLTAAFTIRRAGEPGVDAAQAERARRWAAGVSKVARQEMEHLALVNNLLLAIGAAPHFWRPPFPVAYGYFPVDLEFHLMSFGPDSLARFIRFEAPDPTVAIGPETGGLAAAAGGPSSGGSPLAEVSPGPARSHAAELGVALGSVQDLLTAVRDAVNNVHGFPALDDLFTGDPNKEPVQNFPLGFAMNIFEFTISGPVTATAAIDLMLEQGEGVRAQPDFSSHYVTFSDILAELLAAPFGAAWPMVQDPAPGRVSAPYALALMDAMSYAYVTTLYMLVSWYTFFHPESASGPPSGFSAALQEMSIGPMMTMQVRPLGELLTRAPSGLAGWFAGPQWAIAAADEPLVPSDDPAFFVDRLVELVRREVVVHSLAGSSQPADQPRLEYIIQSAARTAMDFAAISGSSIDRQAVMALVPSSAGASR